MNFFGTDGIRGTYGKTITDSTAFSLGKALAQDFEQPIIVIARDTRLSGDKLFNALVQGVYSGGGNAINLGILPTNSVGHFVRKLGGDYGVMISASHNPPSDNGLKVFDKYGIKLCQSKQQKISQQMSKIFDCTKFTVFEPIFYDIDNIYCDDILEKLPVDLSKLHIALDCCYGSAYKVAKLLFGKCKAQVTAFCDTPNGKLINVGCGANNTTFLSQKLLGCNFDLSFAFDGDCDRLAVFEKQQLLDNNAVLLAIAKYFKQNSRLQGNTVVGTVLTNSGLEKALKKNGMSLVRADVGDTNIIELMYKKGFNVGGEESGHFITTDFATSSDALITALLLCKIYIEMGSLSEYTAEYTALPSTKFDIELNSANENLLNVKDLSAISSYVQKMYPDCRVILRKSGTEPKIRAYIEGNDVQQAQKLIAATLVN